MSTKEQRQRTARLEAKLGIGQRVGLTGSCNDLVHHPMQHRNISGKAGEPVVNVKTSLAVDPETGERRIAVETHRKPD